MTIRCATEDDADAVASIYAPIVQGTTISFELDPPSVPEMRLRIASTLARFPWLVNTDVNGRVAGYAYASRHREPGAYQWAVNVSVYVRQDVRRSGVGASLYRRLLAELKNLGYFQAFAGIALPNDASIGLHERMGFKPLGVYRDVGFKHGAWCDVGWWQCPLNPPAVPTPPQVFDPAGFGTLADARHPSNRH